MSRVVVIGNAGLDLPLAVSRLPLPGETLIGRADARAPGGKGLNQAVVAARCRGAVRFCAPLGNDDAETAVLEGYLRREGFAELHLPRLPHPTDFSLLMVLPDGENSIVSTSACSLAMSYAQAEPALHDLRDGDVVLLQGNLALDTTGAILAAAGRRGAMTVFNPAPFWPGAENLVERCSLVIANRGEAEALGSSLRAARAAIVTLGAEGCTFMEGERRHSFAAEPVSEVDTTACGDAFCGVMAALLARGMAIADAIPRAQKAAALTAMRRGAYAALPSSEELCSIQID